MAVKSKKKKETTNKLKASEKRANGKKKAANEKKNKNQSKLMNEIAALLVIALGIFIFISLQTKAAGSVGEFFEEWLKGCFSRSAFILPYCLIIYGALLLIGKVGFLGKRSAAFLMIFLVGLIMLNSIRFYDDGTFYAFSMDSISNMYQEGILSTGGGVFGGILSITFIKWFGVPGAYIISVTLIIVSLILLTNTPLSTIIINLKVNNKSDNREETVKINDIQNDESDYEGPAKGKKYNEKQIKILDYMKDEGLFDKKNINIKTSEDERLEMQDNQPADEKKKVSEEKTKDDIEEIKINVGPDTGVNYKLPAIDLLNKKRVGKNNRDRDNLVAKASTLEKTLKNFDVSAKVVEVSKGPTVTRYEIQPSPGVKVSKIVRLADDIALNLEAASIRIEAPIPGKAAVGIEIQNDSTSPVTIREVLESTEFKNNKSKISFAVGKDISGNPVVTDLGKMPHLLIAGATGAGKSVCINSIIVSILYKARPEEVKMVLIDPKVVELNVFNEIPHLLIPVVTDPSKAAAALNWAVQEMTNRYKVFAEESVRDIEAYNKKMEKEDKDQMPQIVVIIDELADLMMAAPSQVEESICRLAQMARAAGMHLIVATQRPSVDVITGVIKANIPSRIAFSVSSMADSRTILDMGGAEKLLGRGDMLFYPSGMSKPVRIQGSLISDTEVERVIRFIKGQVQSSNYSEEIIDTIESGKVNMSSSDTDELLKDAIELVVSAEQASVSMLQRRFRIGYNRAARLIDDMEERGIVGHFDGSRPRRVLISKEDLEELSNT